METIRVSTPEDISAQRELWSLCFGDDGAYVDNFYRTYYRPDRVLVLEEGGQVRAMTAWFDTRFVIPGQASVPTAYLYAVATHPRCQGRGLAGALLAWADQHLGELGMEAVSTVPAQPSLHRFFARNGFQECFTHSQRTVVPREDGPGAGGLSLAPLSPRQYAALREERLKGRAHITLDEEALAYQAGASALCPGGGLYALTTPCGPAAVCTEGMENGQLLVKEFLAPPGVEEQGEQALFLLLPRWSGILRCPGDAVLFGMVKWLSPKGQAGWDGSQTAYLGLAFD